MKSLTKSFQLVRLQHAVFSSKAVAHRTAHMSTPIHPKFYEDDFKSTNIEELEFVRSPFYELAKLHHTKEGEDAQKLLSDIG